MIGEKFLRLQERYSDPLLTALTLMLSILLFVVGPLQAAGIVEAHHFGIPSVLLCLPVFSSCREAWWRSERFFSPLCSSSAQACCDFGIPRTWTFTSMPRPG